MKGSCTLVASVLAASSIALSTSSASASSSCIEDDSRIRSKTMMSTEKEKKFAPRLDGLRFIETLVTAHR